MGGGVLLVLAVMSSVALAAVEQCPSHDTVDNKVYLAHPHSCSLFRRCVGGQPVLGHCPSGQHFSQDTRTCDDKARVRCTVPSGDCSPRSSCRYSCTCSKDSGRSVCPFKMAFDAELQVFDPACSKEPGSFTLKDKLGVLVVRNASATVSMCDPNAGQTEVPHFADCSRAFTCVDGMEEIQECEEGSVYNVEWGYCEDAQDSSCDTQVRSPAPKVCPHDAAYSRCGYKCSCRVLDGDCPARLQFDAESCIFDAKRQPACLSGPAIISLEEQFSAALEVHANTTKVSICPEGHHTPPLYIPDPSNCAAMTVCNGSRQTRISCSQGKFFKPGTHRCVKGDPSQCSVQSTSPSEAPATMDDITCPTNVPCPGGSGGAVPHLTDCTLFCHCGGGGPTLRACPPGLHFSARMQTCVRPDNANCQKPCRNLSTPEGGRWSPSSCVTYVSAETAECSLTCEKGREVIGSEVLTCTMRGWHGSEGLGHLPSCDSPAEVAEEVVDKINTTLNRLDQSKGRTSLLFLLDMSGSVGVKNFQIEKDFVISLVNAFPLSRSRTAGVVTFSGKVSTAISLTVSNTCQFLSRFKSVKYASGSTNLTGALSTAHREINLHSQDRTTLVFVITDGRSETDPTTAARELRSQGHLLFTIGVSAYDRDQLEPISTTHSDGSKLFFGLPSFEVFKVVADYLRTKYNTGAMYECP